jgi:iron complex outermembrane receptor protein
MKHIFLLFGLFVASLGYAQNNTSDSTRNDAVLLGEVQISTTGNSPKSDLYKAVSITKLEPLELKRGNGLFLDDAINANVPGVFMERRTISAGQQFNIRGYGNGVRGTNGASSNFDGQGAKVYLNGIPVTDAEGITVLDDIDFGSISNVAVTKGPAGTLYGLAIAGVVSLQTQKAEKGKVSIGQDVLVGSYGLSRLTSRVQIGTENSSILVNYGHQQSDGFTPHTASHKDFVNFVGDFHPSNKQTVNTYLGYSNSYDERQGELTIEQYRAFDYSGNPAYIKNNAHSNVISVRAGVGHTYRFTKQISNTTTLFGSGVSNNASSAGGWTDKNPINYGLRSTLDLNFSLGENFGLTGVAGIETQRQDAQTIGYNMVVDSANLSGYNIIGAMRSNQATVTKTTSLFTEWALKMPFDFILTAGVGVSNMDITLRDRFYVAANNKPVTKIPTYYHNAYDNLVSPHVALNKVFSKQVSAYINYSKGYKAPVSSYFFIPTTGQVNTNLKPEIGTQFEIGTKGVLFNDKLNYQIAVFKAEFSDKMTTVAVPLNPPAVGTAYSYITNRGSQDDKGLEVLLKYEAYASENGFIKAIKPFVNLAYSDFKYKGYTFQTLSADKKSVVEADFSGKAVAGVAPLTLNAGVDFMTKIGVYGNVNYLYRDAMPFTSDGVNKVAAYGLLNAKLGFAYQIKQFSFDLYAGATNITGTQYSYKVFVNQLPDAYLPAPNKINYFGGINLKYNF